jgi:hypothetical protein
VIFGFDGKIRSSQILRTANNFSLMKDENIEIDQFGRLFCF